MTNEFLRSSLATLLCLLALILFRPASALATNPFSETAQLLPASITTDTLAALGFDLEIDGDYAIIGAYQGGAAMLKKNPSQAGQWTPIRYFSHQIQYGGSAVGIAGNFAFVGSPFELVSGQKAGKVFIYEQNTGGADNWGLYQVLQPTGTPTTNPIGDAFGYSLDVSGNMLIVGTKGRGTAFIFTYNTNTNQWEAVKEIQPSDATYYDNFANNVAIEGDVAMVGAPLEGEDAQGGNAIQYAGAVYVYQRHAGGTDNWGQTQKLVASDRGYYHQFGWNLQISGDYAAIGAPNHNNVSGSAYLFKKDLAGPGLWGELKTISPLGSANMQAGSKLCLNQNYLLIGAPGDATDANGANAMTAAGSVFVYEQNEGGAGNWGLLQKLDASDRASTDYFGFSLAVDDSTIMVGASHKGYVPGTIADPQFGQVYVFTQDAVSNNNGGGQNNPPGPAYIGETGQVQAGLSWVSVQLQQTYQNPVVVAGAASSNQSYRAAVRVRNVSSGSFEVRLDNWDCSYSQHSAETINYLVVEAGTYTLPNGSQLSAGITTNVKDRFLVQSLPAGFATTPVLLVQCATDNYNGSLVTRINHRNTNAGQVDLRVQNQEGQGAVTVGEDVHWVAVAAGVQATGLACEAQLSGRYVKHKWYTLGFNQSYSNPVFLTNMNSSYGHDAAATRYRNLGSTSVQVKVEEDNCFDSETKHTRENMGFVVFDQPGLLQGTALNANGAQHFSFIHPGQSVEEADAEIRMRAFPNPVREVINIELSGVEAHEKSEVSVYDLSGRLLLRQTFAGLAFQLEVAQLQEGIYFLQVAAGPLRQSFRFVKLP